MSRTGTSGRTGLVDVWLVDVGSAGAHGGARLLDHDERAVLHRLRVAADRQSYLVAHVLLRLALSRAANGRVPPGRWRFGRSACGRPSVAPDSGAARLDFSLSRSSGLAAVAVASAEGCRAGIDAERCDLPLHCIPADVALSAAERTRLATFPADRQPSEFLKLWTLKEAYGKLRGRGICFPMERVEVAASPARLVRTEEGLPPSQDVHLYTREVHTMTGVYHTSLAVECPPGVRPHVSLHVLDRIGSGPAVDPGLPEDEDAVEHSSGEEAR